MSQNRFRYGQHKKVVHIHGSQLSSDQEGTFYCVSEKCPAKAPTLLLLGEQPHECRQNHGPANQPRQKTSQRRQRRRDRRRDRRGWDFCTYAYR